MGCLNWGGIEWESNEAVIMGLMRTLLLGKFPGIHKDEHNNIRFDLIRLSEKYPVETDGSDDPTFQSTSVADSSELYNQTASRLLTEMMQPQGILQS